jgi:hypothetical protein
MRSSVQAFAFGAAVAATTAAVADAAGAQPHILAILSDDHGWAEVSWHRPAGYEEVVTPNLQGLVESGIELDRQCA